MGNPVHMLVPVVAAVLLVYLPFMSDESGSCALVAPVSFLINLVLSLVGRFLVVFLAGRDRWLQI